MRWVVAVVLVLAFLAPQASAAVVSHTAQLGTAWNTQRKLVQAPDGTLYAAVLVRNATDAGHVVLVRSTDAGRTWNRLPVPYPGTVETLRPSLAVAADGDLWVAWTQFVPAMGHLQVFAARWNGEGWHDLIQISHTSGYSGYPAMAIDSRGDVHVGWYGLHGEGYRILYRERTPDGTWTPAIHFETGQPDAVNPDVVVGPGDQVHIAWYKLQRPVWRIYYVTRTPESNWTLPVALSGADSNAANPNELVLPDGRLLVAWNAPDASGRERIWTEVVQGPPAHVSRSPARVASPEGVAATYPTMTVDPRGGVLAAWTTPQGIQVWRLSDEGVPEAPLGSLGHPGAGFPSFSRDVPVQGIAQMLYTDKLPDGSYAVPYVLVTANGTLVQPPTSEGANVVPHVPALAGDGGPAAVAVVLVAAIVALRWRRRRG